MSHFWLYLSQITSIHIIISLLYTSYCAPHAIVSRIAGCLADFLQKGSTSTQHSVALSFIQKAVERLTATESGILTDPEIAKGIVLCIADILSRVNIKVN